MSDMIIPVMIPMKQEEPKCPSCGKDEEQITVCKHCGYEYKDEPMGWFGNTVTVILAILVIFVFVWFIFLMVEWLGFNDGRSLVEIIVDQWDWLTELRII